MISPVRIVAGAAGVLAGLYGVYRLHDLGWANTRAMLTWLVGGIVLHDGVLAGVTIGLALLGIRVMGHDRLTPWAVGLVILAPVTLLSIPELGRFGARPDNPSLLDRNYWAGWWVMVALVVAAIVVRTYVHHRRQAVVTPSDGGDDGPGAGGR